MTDLKEHFASRGSASSLLTSRLSKHPDRYPEIFRVLRKYKLQHVIAELGMSHHHDDEDDDFHARTSQAPDAHDAHADGDGATAPRHDAHGEGDAATALPHDAYADSDI